MESQSKKRGITCSVCGETGHRKGSKACKGAKGKEEEEDEENQEKGEKMIDEEDDKGKEELDDNNDDHEEKKGQKPGKEMEEDDVSDASKAKGSSKKAKADALKEWTLLPSTNAQLTGNLTLEKTSPNGWDVVTRGSLGWSKGKHVWSVKLESKANALSAGVCNRAKISFKDAAANSDCRIDLFFGNGKVVEGSGDDETETKCFGCAVKMGDQVKISLDLDEKTVTFGLNDEKPSKPFKLNGGEKWFPYICMGATGAKVTIIPK